MFSLKFIKIILLNNTGSDGPNSFIRKKIDSSLLQFEYDQQAIVATLKIAKVVN